MIISIIGAGIVGLHCAHELRKKGNEIIVLDKAPHLAEHTSGRNSGVIHAGIFYKPESFKERVCIEGNHLTYEWLRRLNVAHLTCGKWVVPEEGQDGDLEPFYCKISRLPIPQPLLKTAHQLRDEEPNLRSSRALFIPSTGILDAADYVKKLAAYVERMGVTLVTHCQVLEIRDHSLMTNRGELMFDLAINCAGLHSDEIARRTGLTDYEIKPCRGDYYVIQKKLIQRPIYHLPYAGSPGLGVHLTPTVEGHTLVGPNAYFISDKDDYKNHSEPLAFEKGVRFFLPQMKPTPLLEAYSGNRPKLFFNREPHEEFAVVKHKNWIHLLGIESPGLTAAPALAKHVEGMI